MAIFQVNLGYPVASFILKSDWCKTFWSQNARTDNDQKKYVLDLHVKFSLPHTKKLANIKKHSARFYYYTTRNILMSYAANRISQTTTKNFLASLEKSFK